MVTATHNWCLIRIIAALRQRQLESGEKGQPRAGAIQRFRALTSGGGRTESSH